ncbi:MAG: hypothetical protein LBG60_17815 [Bifidobacteriaceae bacterium]|jgi:hypothetical protein|nr:hypothetical protein [Bifidobacteriaceae bacterium]
MHHPHAITALTITWLTGEDDTFAGIDTTDAALFSLAKRHLPQVSEFGKRGELYDDRPRIAGRWKTTTAELRHALAAATIVTVNDRPRHGLILADTPRDLAAAFVAQAQRDPAAITAAILDRHGCPTPIPRQALDAFTQALLTVYASQAVTGAANFTEWFDGTPARLEILKPPAQWVPTGPPARPRGAPMPPDAPPIPKELRRQMRRQMRRR